MWEDIGETTLGGVMESKESAEGGQSALSAGAYTRPTFQLNPTDTTHIEATRRSVPGCQVSVYGLQNARTLVPVLFCLICSTCSTVCLLAKSP